MAFLLKLADTDTIETVGQHTILFHYRTAKSQLFLDENMRENMEKIILA